MPELRPSRPVDRRGARPLPGVRPLPAYGPAGLGLGGVLASVVAADVWAALSGRPTISRSIATCLEHPVLGPVVFGGLCGLGWHLVVDPIVRRLTD